MLCLYPLMRRLNKAFSVKMADKKPFVDQTQEQSISHMTSPKWWVSYPWEIECLTFEFHGTAKSLGADWLAVSSCRRLLIFMHQHKFPFNMMRSFSDKQQESSRRHAMPSIRISTNRKAFGSFTKRSASRRRCCRAIIGGTPHQS